VHFLEFNQPFNSQSVLDEFLLFFILLCFEFSELREFIVDVLIKIETSGLDVTEWLFDMLKVTTRVFLGHFFKKLFLLLFFPERKLIFRNEILKHDTHVFRFFVQTPKVRVIKFLNEFVNVLDLEIS
jgi:hypothetical protein